MVKNCLTCGADLPFWKYRNDAKFCDSQCKDVFHNKIRMLKARKAKAIKAIEDIKLFETENPKFGAVCGDLLIQIQNSLSESSP